MRRMFTTDALVRTGVSILAALGSACFAAQGQTPAPAASEEKAAGPPPRNPLWVIGEGQSKVYLLGTIHLMSARSYPLSEVIEKAYSDSKVIVFESDMRAINRPDTQVRLTQSGTYQRGGALKKSVSPATYAQFEKHCAYAGLPVERMDRFRPWFCGITLTMLEVRKLGYDLEYGTEQYFHTRARKDGKKSAYFESIDENFEIFTGLSKREDEELLLQTMDDLELVRRDAAVLFEDWQTGDMDGLGAKLLQSFRKRPGIGRRLLTDRNRKWLPRIEEHLKSGQTTLIVVGAAHALGPGGLIELLKKNGHAIRQL